MRFIHRSRWWWPNQHNPAYLGLPWMSGSVLQIHQYQKNRAMFFRTPPGSVWITRKRLRSVDVLVFVVGLDAAAIVTAGLAADGVEHDTQMLGLDGSQAVTHAGQYSA
jgi:hypothetical protein